MKFVGKSDYTVEIPVIDTAAVWPAHTSGRPSALPTHLQFRLLPIGEKDDTTTPYGYGTLPPLLGSWLKVPAFVASFVIFLCGLALVFQIGWHTGPAPRYDAAEGSQPSQSQEATAPSPNVTTSSKPQSPKPTNTDGGNNQPVDQPTRGTEPDDKPGIQPVAITEGKPAQSPSPTPTPTAPVATTTQSSSPTPTATSEPPVVTPTPEPTTTSPPVVVVTDKPTASAPPETPEATAPPSGTTVP